MTSAADTRARTIGPVVAVAIGATWAFRQILLLIPPSSIEPVAGSDWVRVMTFSTALAVLPAAAWLFAELSARRRSVAVAAVVMAVGSLVAALANFIEDGVGVASFGEVFGYGLGGVLGGLIGLAATLTLARHYVLAALAVATFAGLFMSNEAGGGFVILGAWVLLAVRMRRDNIDVLDRDRVEIQG